MTWMHRASTARRSLFAAGITALMLAGSGLAAAAPTFAKVKPNFVTNSFWVNSIAGSTLTVHGTGGTLYVVTVDPSASLHRRFYGTFSLSDIGEIQTTDRLQMSYRTTGPNALTAYMIQDYSLQIAHSEIEGTVISVAPGFSAFTLQVSKVFGGSNAAYHPGQLVRVNTPNPSSIPVSYTQGGPTCGHASCMVRGLNLELYGLSDRPNQNINDPRAIAEVPVNAPQLVHASSD